MILSTANKYLRTTAPGWCWFAGIICPSIKLFKAYAEVEKLYMNEELEIEVYDTKQDGMKKKKD